MAGFFTDEFIEDVRNANDIVEVISDYVKLKKSGKNYFGLCPFHTEKTPSFSVSPERQIFHCFGCSEGGNVITFISKVENLDFVETINLLATRAKITVPDFTTKNSNDKTKNLKDTIYEINTETAKYFRNNLQNSSIGKTAREYLEKRGVVSNIIQKFGIGFAHGLNNDLYIELVKKGYNTSDILASGVITKNEKNNINDRFKMRLMFPIFDVRGRVIAFGGRVMDKSLPKYLNSPETQVFSKGKNLYGMNFAKNSKEKTVIVVEGYMDAIALYQKGMDNVVASLGTALTDNQARLIGKYFENVAISYDSDTAGQTATLRGLDIISNVGIPVKVVQFEGAKDPDELVKTKGIQTFKDFVNNAKDLSEYKIDLIKKDYDLEDNRGKITFVNKVAGILANLSNNIERDVYVKKVSKETGIGIEPIYAEINKILYNDKTNLKTINTTKVITMAKNVNNENITKKVLNTERLLIAILSSEDEKSIEIIKKELNQEDIKTESTRRIIEAIYKNYEKSNTIKCANVISMLDNEQDISIYTDILQKEVIESDNIKLAKQLIDTIKKEKLEKRKKEILTKMQTENTENDLKEELNNELAKVIIELKQISK